MDFVTLPAEVRLSILEMVADSSTKMTIEYATVSKEWQSVFEKKHFERILLSSRRLKSFAQIVQGARRKLVKHIWLRAELDDDDNPGFRSPVSLIDEPEFFNTIERLLRILSTWERPVDLNKEGLTLELSAWSLCDNEFDLRFVNDPYSESFKRVRFTIDHNMLSRSTFGRAFPSRGASSRSSNDLAIKAEGTATEDMPKVDIVTTFLLRRQYYARVSSDRIAQIFGSLVGLERIIYEPPESAGNVLETLQEKRHWLLSDNNLPQTLKQLTIFEDPFHRNSLMASNRVCAANNPEIAMTLFRESLNLEHLSASFIVDAKDFFQPFWPSTPAYTNWTWHKLKTIALTSKLLDPYQPSEEVNGLLYVAGIAARNMPALRVMEIWNGFRTSYGCFFRYYDDGSASTITWRGTWELDLEPRVMYCWTETVRKNTGYHDVGFRDMELPIDGTSFPASILRHLKLKDQIAHPMSLHQLQLLGEPRRHNQWFYY
ncbi:hypothetical protein F4815DRAFT_477741 [Daldinia loculata]|nr:hypothetical protein F4815DRAFT_477741 [Daldinia loculata]